MNVLLVLVNMVALLGGIHVQPVRGEKVVTCYLDSSSLAEPVEDGYYTVKAMEEATKYCTHIIYGMADLDSDTLKIKSHEPWNDLKTITAGTFSCNGTKDCDADNNYKNVTGLKTKNRKLKVLLAIGGATDSKGTKYSDLVADDTKMNTFISDAITFLTDHNFDGLDLDWEYPGKTGNDDDKANFVTWVKKLKNEFNKHNKKTVNVNKQLMLTAAVMSQLTHATTGYDIPSLCKELDYIHLMTYDIHGAWKDEKTTVDHHAPLKERTDNTMSVESSVTLWKEGCGEGNKHKLVVGVPLYGRTFTLTEYDATDKTSYSIGAAASGMGARGSLTKQKGWISYLEICTNIKSNSWTKVNGTKIIGPYAYGPDPSDTSKYTWVGYDDANMAENKTKYVKEQGLGGVMVWSIDYADHNNTCGDGKYPLLKKMSDELKKP